MANTDKYECRCDLANNGRRHSDECESAWLAATADTSQDVHATVAHIRKNGGIISDTIARTIASWWHSPSPADRAITKLSHGIELDSADLTDLHDIIAENIAVAETEQDRMALVALTHWVIRQQES